VTGYVICETIWRRDLLIGDDTFFMSCTMRGLGIIFI
jgi:hypothetical protein